MRVAIAFSMCVFMVGCAASVKSVEVKGEIDDKVKLAGKWKGVYKGTQTGREGTVEFDLAVGRHHAEGQVMMYAGQDRSKGHPLQIRFVEVKDGQITGKITPYMDPRCKCQVKTEFTGHVTRDTIEGSFVSFLPKLNLKQSGTWVVYRQGRN